MHESVAQKLHVHVKSEWSSLDAWAVYPRGEARAYRLVCVWEARNEGGGGAVVVAGGRGGKAARGRGGI